MYIALSVIAKAWGVGLAVQGGAGLGAYIIATNAQDANIAHNRHDRHNERTVPSVNDDP